MQKLGDEYSRNTFMVAKSLSDKWRYVFKVPRKGMKNWEIIDLQVELRRLSPQSMAKHELFIEKVDRQQLQKELWERRTRELNK